MFMEKEMALEKLKKRKTIDEELHHRSL